VHHLEGDFPGGVADLHFRFTLRDGLISRLVIEPLDVLQSVVVRPSAEPPRAPSGQEALSCSGALRARPRWGKTG
jgi:hypothetical protein